jgi:BirA family transcriptional regulator, biotin operon repressor / biotin---[acetyl-CoA-carboxylase] ligase
MAELLTQKRLSEGTVVVAKHQTAGRGQMTNIWESEPYQNITLSIVLYPSFLPIAQHFLLNQAVALAISDGVSQTLAKQSKIKWSNDIYVAQRKIAGILIQNSIQGSTIQHSIIGIGLNVNQTIFTSNAPNATSLTIEYGEYFNIDDIIALLCENIEKRYLQLRQQKFQLIRLDYVNVLYQREQWCHYERVSNQERFLGKIEGVKDDGHLIMQTNRGLELFSLKEIKFLGY